jgi:hypothetical protein
VHGGTAEIVLDRDTRLDSRDDLAPTAAIQVSEIREVAITHTQRITVRFACSYANEITYVATGGPAHHPPAVWSSAASIALDT